MYLSLELAIASGGGKRRGRGPPVRRGVPGSSPKPAPTQVVRSSNSSSSSSRAKGWLKLRGPSHPCAPCGIAPRGPKGIANVASSLLLLLLLLPLLLLTQVVLLWAPSTSTVSRRNRPGHTLGDWKSPNDLGARPSTKSPEGCNPISRKSHRKQGTHNARSKKLAFRQSDSKLHPPRHQPNEVRDRPPVGPSSQDQGVRVPPPRAPDKKTPLAEQRRAQDSTLFLWKRTGSRVRKESFRRRNPWSLRIG